MDQFYVAPGVDGFFVDGSGTRYPVQRFGDDFIMQELGVDSMALVDTNQVTMMMVIMMMMMMVNLLDTFVKAIFYEDNEDGNGDEEDDVDGVGDDDGDNDE